jgi:hypothetical protein
MRPAPGSLLRALGCLALCTLASCRPDFEPRVSSLVLAVDGSGGATRDGNTVRLTTAARVEPGAKIRAQEDARVDLMLLPGILVELSGAGEFEIKQLRLARNGNETIHPMATRQAHIRLPRGLLVAAIGQTQTRSRLFVETAAGTFVAGSGRAFLIEVTGQKTRVMSVRGRVAFEPVGGGVSTKIEAGFFAEWPRNAAPQPAADAGPEAQADVSRIMTVKRRLLRLEKEERTAFLPWRR